MVRLLARGSQVVIDMLVLSVAYWLAFLFRFEFSPPLQFMKLLFFTWPYVILLQYLVLSLFGVPRFAWRYVGMREARRVLIAVGVSAAVLVIMRLTLAPLGGYFQFAVIPLSVLGMNFVLSFVGIIGVRAMRRTVSESQSRKKRTATRGPLTRTLLIGAGEAGVLVAKEIQSRPDLGIEPIGFLDDNLAKVGTEIHGVPVLGTTEDIASLAELHRIRNVLITIANAPGSEIRRITLACQDAALDTKIIPGIYEIVGGKVNLSRIRKVAIDDLLGREAVSLDEDAIAGVVRNRVVLVTGAAGSIGSELCRQVSRFSPDKLVLVERAETPLFEIHAELLRHYPKLAVVPCIADVTDVARMQSLFSTHKPAVVFHAAAHKHVPMMEDNPGEAVKNNLIGTRRVAELASRSGVSEFVLISTDKAVNPTSIMGATKRGAELLVHGLAETSDTRFVIVRFGNVLGSAGSVIPVFQKQIERGGPVTVTHRDMTRYFMTISEASQLVLQAASMDDGELFILDMGEPVKIVDLAHDLIRLSGLEPGEDIDVEFSGVRPGEKLFEQLATGDEDLDKTVHPKIFVGQVQSIGLDKVRQKVDALADKIDSKDARAVAGGLAALVPEYTPSNTVDVAAVVRLDDHRTG